VPSPRLAGGFCLRFFGRSGEVNGDQRAPFDIRRPSGADQVDPSVLLRSRGVREQTRSLTAHRFLGRRADSRRFQRSFGSEHEFRLPFGVFRFRCGLSAIFGRFSGKNEVLCPIGRVYGRIKAIVVPIRLFSCSSVNSSAFRGKSVPIRSEIKGGLGVVFAVDRTRTCETGDFGCFRPTGHFRRLVSVGGRVAQSAAPASRRTLSGRGQTPTGECTRSASWHVCGRLSSSSGRACCCSRPAELGCCW
jgi:hypothetical protein